MTNWFQTHRVKTVFGWGPSKRMIVQGGVEVHDELRMMNDELVVRLRALTEQARKEGCVYVEVRCFEDYSAYREAFEEAGFVYEPHYDVHIDPAKDVSEAKMRQIRKATKDGYRWREANLSPSPSQRGGDLEEWYKCLRRLYWRKIRRPVPGVEFFRDLIANKGCRLLVVEKADDAQGTRHHEIVGGVLLAVEDDKRKAYEWYICGQVMSTWAAIEWCRQNGVACFDTMGAGRPGVPYGVRDFKLQMGGELKEFGRYKYICKPMLYRWGERVMGLASKSLKIK